MHSCNDSIDAPERVGHAARVLRAGGLAVYPTETVYGLGADAFNASALARLTALKVRQRGKPISVLIGDLEMLEDLVTEISAAAAILIRRFWPGPLTLVLPARASVSPVLTGEGSGIGVRLSSHPVATALVRALGRPLTTPSANPAGMPPPTRIEAARAYFGEHVDYYLDAGPLRGQPTSTVVDVRDGLRVLREGAIELAAIRAAVDEAV